MGVQTPSRDELLRRRQQLLDHARISRDKLDVRAERGELVGDEYWLWEALRSIDFLLGEDE